MAADADLDVEQHRLEEPVAEPPDRVGEADGLDDLDRRHGLGDGVASQGSSPGRERTSSRRMGWSSGDGALVGVAPARVELPSIAALRHSAAWRIFTGSSCFINFRLIFNLYCSILLMAPGSRQQWQACGRMARPRQRIAPGRAASRSESPPSRPGPPAAVAESAGRARRSGRGRMLVVGWRLEARELAVLDPALLDVDAVQTVDQGAVQALADLA